MKNPVDTEQLDKPQLLQLCVALHRKPNERQYDAGLGKVLL